MHLIDRALEMADMLEETVVGCHLQMARDSMEKAGSCPPSKGKRAA